MDDNASDYDRFHALEIINNWRSSHGFPLNTFQTGLRKKAQSIEANALVAQRIKRLSSISHKLERFPKMNLSRMQDIGGCRAVVKSVGAVRHLVTLYDFSQSKHERVRMDDYIREPKNSGYRGVHLVYSYKSDKNEVYNGHKIEMQLRSTLQHAWATAVETVGTFTEQALKSSRGDDTWLRFFALMGTEIARRERSPLVPDTPEKKTNSVAELRSLAKSLDVAHRLHAYGVTLRVTSENEQMSDAHYFLLALDSEKQTLNILPFKQAQLPQAADSYLAAEKRLAGKGDAVLVSVDSLTALRRAYPNYFLDTELFSQAVKKALS